MNKSILITGCQRSGTTLLNLVLDSHPDITGIDELDFDKVPLREYLDSPKYQTCVSFKLPRAAHQVGILEAAMPGVKVLWCIRDPRDVILSMMTLSLKSADETSLPWVASPLGAKLEIERSAGTLQKSVSGELAEHYKTYRAIAEKQPASWLPEESAFVASLCWRVKQELLVEYDAMGIGYHIVHYENLIRDSEDTIRDVLQFIGVPWHNNVLKHHQLHTGVSVGGTVNSRPIDASNTGKWVTALDARTLSIIKNVCSDAAAKHGYRLSD